MEFCFFFRRRWHEFTLPTGSTQLYADELGLFDCAPTGARPSASPIIDAIKMPLHTPWAQLRRSLSSLACAHTVLTGDTNLVAAGEGRLDVATGWMRPQRQERAGLLEDICSSSFSEIVADGYSRRQYRAGELDLLSLIDRVLMKPHTYGLDATSGRSSMRLCRATTRRWSVFCSCLHGVVVARFPGELTTARCLRPCVTRSSPSWRSRSRHPSIQFLGCWRCFITLLGRYVARAGLPALAQHTHG